MTAPASVAAAPAPATPPQEAQPLIAPTWLPFEWVVALRFLRDGSTQTLFILGGVAIGVGVIVFMSALLSGMQANFVARVLTGQPHLRLLPPKEQLRSLRAAGAGATNGAELQAAPQRVQGIDQWQGIVAQSRAAPEVDVVSPVASGSALALRGDVSRAVTLTGIDPDSYFRVVPIPRKLVRGSVRLTGSDILVGTELAADLGVAVGDRLRIATAAGAFLNLTITGLFDLGNKAANARTTFVSLRTAQNLLGLPGGVTSIDLTLHDVYAAEILAQRLARSADVQADSWIRTNEQFFSAVSAQTAANTAIRFFVALSVAFGIASVLIVSVVQRSREIGILRAMGISRGQVMRLFLLQGALLGFGGALAGIVLGGSALLAWGALQRNPDGTPLFPLVVEPAMFAAALAVATLTGLLAGLAPAMRAARLDPVEAIRG